LPENKQKGGIAGVTVLAKQLADEQKKVEKKPSEQSGS
jgi:hypothetical protein